MIDIADIKRMRDNNVPWEEIGRQYNLSGEAIRARYKRLKKSANVQSPSIDGLTPDDFNIDPEQAWQKAIKRQERAEKTLRRQQNQRVTVPVPCGIAVLSDLHLGNKGTDYKSIRRDAEIIKNTERMYAIFNGDGVDNWVMGRLTALQRNQAVSFDEEWALFFDWLDMLKGKFLVVVAGNHDNWTYRLAGVDRVREALQGTTVLYDMDEVTFTLQTGGVEHRVKIRHKWKGSSIFNPTHGIEVSWERGGYDFDIGIGGHTHIGTVHRPFIRQGRTMHAILTSTYKTRDTFGRQIGFASPHNRGSGVMIFDKSGHMQFFSDIAVGASFLTHLLAST